jgi:hypothetical protein
MQGFRSDHLTNTSLQGESSIPATAPWRRTRSLGSEVLKITAPIPKLPIKEAPTIAELGVVVPKLKAVITQSQKRDTAFKASEGLLQIGIRNLLGIQPQLVQYAVISEAQLRARKPCGLHYIPVRLPQRFDRNLEWQCQ